MLVMKSAAAVERASNGVVFTFAEQPSDQETAEHEEHHNAVRAGHSQKPK
jgi:hypothetical protein